jgi:hypothetical protein
MGLLLWLGACEECTPDTTRCTGARVDICDADGQWQKLMDCDALYASVPFQCCADPEGGYNCLPEEECSNADN